MCSVQKVYNYYENVNKKVTSHRMNTNLYRRFLLSNIEELINLYDKISDDTSIKKKSSIEKAHAICAKIEYQTENYLA